jgi:hypothetical protein
VIVLNLVSLWLVVLTVIPSAAHAMEWPGKMRLSRKHYLAVQPSTIRDSPSPAPPGRFPLSRWPLSWR